jgi:hypothetical protein
MMDNYTVSRNRAQQYFLGLDQEKILRTWALRHDDASIFVDFLGKPYRICRSTGEIFHENDGGQADFNVVLSIFDLLCHESREKTVTGRFAPVNSLKGNAAVGVGTDFHTPFAACIDRNPEAFCRACKSLGGIPVHMGDIGYRFSVFGDLDVILKFYHSDEDFPASVTLLWEENMLQFVYYETVFYIAGALLRQLGEEM